MKNIANKLILLIILVVGVFTLLGSTAFAATPTINSATATPSTNSAALNGVVNPNGSSTTAWFETPAGGPFQMQNIGNGNSAISLLSYNLTGLNPNTTYTFRIVAANDSGPINGPWTSFTTTNINNCTMPTISSVSPSFVYAGAGTTNIILNGSNFISGTTSALFNGSPRTTSVSSSGQLTMTLTSSDVSSAGTFNITVTNGTGCTSGAIIFTVNSSNNSCTMGSPVIYSLSPSSITINRGTTNITINGSNFDPGDTVFFNGSFRDFSYINSSQIILNLNYYDTNSIGNFTVRVSNNCGNISSATFSVLDYNDNNNCNYYNNYCNNNNNNYNNSSVTTGYASNITDYGATLNGTVYPNYSSSYSNCYNYNGYNGYNYYNNNNCYNYGNYNPSYTTWFQYGTASGLWTYSETAHLYQGTSSYSNFPFYQSLNNLSPNTTYYFRAVSSDGSNTIKGNIVSFRTTYSYIPTYIPTYSPIYTPPVYNYTPPTPVNGATTTVQSTYQSQTSARLNGIFANMTNSSAVGHFEYGTDVSLGSSTNPISLGANSSATFGDTLSGLTAGTIYYFRAVVVAQGITYPGSILVFQTQKNIISNNTTTNTNYQNTTVYQTGPTVTTTKSSVIQIENNKDQITNGDELDYLITFKNNNTKNFENTKITVQLPNEIVFEDSNFGKTAENNTVTFDVGIMVPNQAGSMTIKGKLNSQTPGNSILTTTAVMSYNLTGSNALQTEIAYVINHAVIGNALAAGAIFGSNFLPSSLFGWLFLILIIFAIILLVKKMYSDRFTPKNHAMNSSDHINHLPM